MWRMHVPILFLAPLLVLMTGRVAIEQKDTVTPISMKPVWEEGFYLQSDTRKERYARARTWCVKIYNRARESVRNGTLKCVIRRIRWLLY